MTIHCPGCHCRIDGDAIPQPSTSSEWARRQALLAAEAAVRNAKDRRHPADAAGSRDTDRGDAMTEPLYVHDCQNGHHGRLCRTTPCRCECHTAAHPGEMTNSRDTDKETRDAAANQRAAEVIRDLAARVRVDNERPDGTVSALVDDLAELLDRRAAALAQLATGAHTGETETALAALGEAVKDLCWKATPYGGAEADHTRQNRDED